MPLLPGIFPTLEMTGKGSGKGQPWLPSAQRAPRQRMLLAGIVRDPSRAGNTWRPQDALGCPDGRAGPGNQPREVIERTMQTVELGRRTAEEGPPLRRGPLGPGTSLNPAVTSLGESTAARHSCRRAPILLPLLSLLLDDIIAVHKHGPPTGGGRRQKCLVLLVAGPLCG